MWSLASSFGFHAAAFACAGLITFGFAGNDEAGGFAGTLSFAPPPSDRAPWSLDAEPERPIELDEIEEPVLVERELDEEVAVECPAPRVAAASSFDLERELRRACARLERSARNSAQRVCDVAPSPVALAQATEVSAPIEEEYVAARILDAPTPTYPRMSVRLGEQGAVLLEITVRPDGGVRSVAVVESSGSERLDDAAVEAVANWRFRPASCRGVAVEGHLMHRVTFQIEQAR